jgi:hypothetical protein
MIPITTLFTAAARVGTAFLARWREQAAKAKAHALSRIMIGSALAAPTGLTDFFRGAWPRWAPATALSVGVASGVLAFQTHQARRIDPGRPTAGMAEDAARQIDENWRRRVEQALRDAASRERQQALATQTTRLEVQPQAAVPAPNAPEKDAEPKTAFNPFTYSPTIDAPSAQAAIEPDNAAPGAGPEPRSFGRMRLHGRRHWSHYGRIYLRFYVTRMRR